MPHDLDDIEDIVSVEDVTPNERFANKPDVVPKVRKKNNAAFKQEEITTDSIVPGTQNIYVKTWGCSHNNSDGEYMAGQLAAYGYTITDKAGDADLWLLNSCTVKNPAEDHFRNEVKAAQKAGKHLVVSGCVPQAQPRMDYIHGVSIVGVQQIDRVVEVVEETLKGHTVRLLGQKKADGKKIGGASLNLPKIRKNPLVEIIAINTGCLNQCTYCKTKYARGELGSYPPQEIVQRAKQSFEEGVCEIWLTSEDIGAYGKDIGVTITELLWQLVEVIPENCMMRIGMTNPPYILEHLEEMSKILSHPRVYSFLHVPVQSGSDCVLADMKREYNVDDFRHVVDFLKARVPGVTIATDVICGFPTETVEDFKDTLKLIDDYKFPSVFINQFFPRPATPAAKMHQVPADEKKRRTKELSTLFKSYETYSHKIGERQQVLVTEESHDKKYYVGHNKFYEQVLVPKEERLLGKMIEVEIASTGKHFQMGKLIDNSRLVTPSIVEPLQKGQISGVSAMSSLQATSSKTPRWLRIALVVALLAAFLDIIKISYQYVLNTS
ncbi:threonylcarbamoyladenosine tRNA methylthiotransferase-like [Anneissia japonica]|uniref:threonylcarbamoyladenosine tRNA methylthiotransferase-like n=1 Tax=Anneissia japonica TaxID=1529436 RepID=UPI0014254F66|nr:threonylcarbamoyladenosine tRNA methylthiotransferase-like [Anneissia japonica]